MLILRGETGISVNDIFKITRLENFEYALYLINQIENSLTDFPFLLKYNPAKKRYFLSIPNEYYKLLSEENLIHSIYPKSILATLACIIIEMENGTVSIEKLKEIRGKSVLDHLKALEKDEYIIIQENIVHPTSKLLTRIDINQVLKGIIKK